MGSDACCILSRYIRTRFSLSCPLPPGHHTWPPSRWCEDCIRTRDSFLLPGTSVAQWVPCAHARRAGSSLCGGDLRPDLQDHLPVAALHYTSQHTHLAPARPRVGWGGTRDTGGQTSQQVVAAYGGTHVVKNTKRPLRQGAHQE